MAGKRREAIDDNERIEERRRRILEAAAVVFARRGYHGARTREIAEEAGVAEGTIYNYYASKRDLLLALIRWMTTESMPEALEQVDAGDLRPWLEAVLRDRLAMLDRRRALIQAVVPEMITDKELRQEYLREIVLPFTTQFLPFAQQIFRTEQLRPLNPRVVLPAIIGGTLAAFFVNEWEDFPIGKVDSREELFVELVSFFLAGLQRHDERPTPMDPEPVRAGPTASEK